MINQGLKAGFLGCLAGAFVALVIGGGRSVMRSHLFEFSETVTPTHILEWALLGGALGLFFAPVVEPTAFRSPRLIQVSAGATFGIALALLSYGGLLSSVIGAAAGAGVGFLAPYWTPHLR